jgi:hypothetical protein
VVTLQLHKAVIQRKLPLLLSQVNLLNMVKLPLLQGKQVRHTPIPRPHKLVTLKLHQLLWLSPHLHLTVLQQRLQYQDLLRVLHRKRLVFHKPLALQ